MKTKLTEKKYLEFFETYLFGDTSDPIISAIDFSYRDVCRTIHGIGKASDKDAILNPCKEVLYEEIERLINTKKEYIDQEGVDKYIKHTFERLIVYFDGGGVEFTIGQAQKWFNMTLKYLSILAPNKTKNIYSFCHVPIDNYILNITKYNKFNTAWSRINNYDEYLDFQKWFRKKYSGIPLDEEFDLWIKTCKFERKKAREEKREKYFNTH